MTTNQEGKHLPRTKAEALQLVRAAKVNARFYIHVANDAELPDTPDKYLPGAFRGCVQVSRGAAERFIVDAFSESLEQRGAALPVRVNVGARRSRWSDKAGGMVEYGEPRILVFIG
jgi:hypothetical protein